MVEEVRIQPLTLGVVAPEEFLWVRLYVVSLEGEVPSRAVSLPWV